MMALRSARRFLGALAAMLVIVPAAGGCAAPRADAPEATESAQVAAARPLYERLSSTTKKLSILGNDLIPFQLASQVTPDLVPQLSRYVAERHEELASLTIDERIAKDTVDRLLGQTPIVMLADTHSVPEIQKRATTMLDVMRAANDRPKVFMFELIDANYQSDVDAYFAGTMTGEALRAKVKWDDNIGYAWDAYLGLLDYLKANQIRTRVCLRPDEKINLYDLRVREQFVLDVIEAELEREPSAQIFVLHGNAHLTGATHLQDMIDTAFPDRSILFQTNMDHVYWDQKWRLSTDAEDFRFDDDYVARMQDGTHPNTFYVHTAAPAAKLTGAFAWMSGQLTEDEATKARLTELAKTAAERYQELVSALDAADVERAATAMTAFDAAIDAWAELALTLERDPKGILAAVDEELRGLRTAR